jgi:hypothetical protein
MSEMQSISSVLAELNADFMNKKENKNIKNSNEKNMFLDAEKENYIAVRKN